MLVSDSCGGAGGPPYLVAIARQEPSVEIAAAPISSAPTRARVLDADGRTWSQNGQTPASTRTWRAHSGQGKRRTPELYQPTTPTASTRVFPSRPNVRS